MQDTRTVYNFKSTCQSCFNDVEFPLLGNYADGELVLQTKDGQGFYIAELIYNPTFTFIVETLQDYKDLNIKETDSQKVLTILADKIGGKEFTTEYPICPVCKKRIRHFSDNARTSKRELPFATWHDLESLEYNDKITKVKEAISTIAK